MKDYGKNKELPYIQYWDVNKSYSWAISQTISVNSFEWVKNISQINEKISIKYFIKSYNEESSELYFLEISW